MNQIDVYNIRDKDCPDATLKSFLSLKEYMAMATKTVCKYANRIKGGLAEEILSNEDALSNIAHSIMLADWQFDGRGTIQGFRSQRIKWAIKGYIARRVKERSRDGQALSINKTSCIGENEDCSISNVLQDKNARPDDIVEYNEQKYKLSQKIEELFKTSDISEKAKDYITKFYIKDIPMSDIAEEYNVTRQSVHNLIKRSMEILKLNAKNDKFLTEAVYGN